MEAASCPYVTKGLRLSWKPRCADRGTTEEDDFAVQRKADVGAWRLL